jgi:hypothetical protein
MGEWFWHNTDPVFTIGDTLELAEGPAEIVLYKDKNQYPGARRVIDLVFLTNDLSLRPGGALFGCRGTAKINETAPILSKFRIPFWFKLVVTGKTEKPAVFSVRPGKWMVNGYWCGPVDVFYPQTAEGKVVWNTKAAGIQTPFETDWMRFDAYTVEVPTFEVSRSQKVEGARFLLANGEPPEKHLLWDSGWPDEKDKFEVICPIGHGFYEHGNALSQGRPMTYEQVMAAQAAAVRDYQVPGRQPKLFAACGYPSHSGIELHQAMGLNASFCEVCQAIYEPEAAKRLGTNTAYVYPNFCPTTIDQKLIDERKASPIGHIPKNYKMLEESGPPSLAKLAADPKAVEAFRSFARERGAEPRKLLKREVLQGLLGKNPTEDDLWKLVEPGSGTQGEAETHPELYYLSRRFRGWYFAGTLKDWTDAIEKVWPQDRTNPGSIFIGDGYGLGLARGLDVFELFRRRAVTSYTSENSWGRDAASYIGPQSMSYEGAIARCLTKYGDFPLGTVGTYLICSGVNGYDVNPEYIPLQGLAAFAHGMNFLWYYFVARDCSTTLFHVDVLKAIKSINFTIGATEEDLLGVRSKVVPAKVAIGWSISTDVWDLTLAPRYGGDDTHMLNNMYPMERHQLFYLLRHCQVPVDLLEERDIEEGRLKDYQVYFLVGDHLSGQAAGKLIDWVKEGGTVISVAGGGLWDENNRPNERMNELFGIQAAPLQKIDIALRPKLELLHRQPLDTAHFDGGDIDYYGYLQSIQLAKGSAAEVIAKTDGGAPAAVRNKAGKGTAILFGFLPGMAYLKPAIPLIPFGRGGLDELSSFIPTAFPVPIRQIFGKLLDEAGIVRPVVCSEPLVEPVLHLGNDGKHRICLVNFSLKPISELRIETAGLFYQRVVDVATGKQVSAAEKAFAVPLDRFRVLRLD